MDLSKIKPVERTLELVHPATGEPIGMRLIMCSGQDDRVKSVIRRHRDAAAMRTAESMQKGGKPTPRSMAEVERENLEVAAATIVGVEFDSGNDWNGSTEYSPELALEIASLDWIATQMSAKLKATGDFFDA